MPGDEPELTSFGTTASGPSTSEAAAPEPVAPSVSSPSATESSSHTPVAPTPSARAMFDFDGGTPEDISFKVKYHMHLIQFEVDRNSVKILSDKKNRGGVNYH